jgi:hypothetical protein
MNFILHEAKKNKHALLLSSWFIQMLQKRNNLPQDVPEFLYLF